MAIIERGITFFSLEELSFKANISEKSFLEYISSEQLKGEKLKGKWFVSKDSLEPFFNKLYEGHIFKYKVPKHIKSNPEPWCKALTKMYDEEFSYPASLSPEQGDMLRAFVSNISPDTVVEIGSYIGISSIWMAAGLVQSNSRGIIHAIDRFNTIKPWPPYFYNYLNDPLEFARSYASLANINCIKFNKTDSSELAKSIKKEIGSSIDLLFIDGDHTIEGCKTDFINYSPYVPKGGYIVLHDIYPDKCGWQGPRYLIDSYIRESNEFEIVEIETQPVNYGMAFIRRV